MTTILKTVSSKEATNSSHNLKENKSFYDNHQEIIEKIQRNDVMSGTDKYMLQYNINDMLSREEHIEVLKIVLQNTMKRTFTPAKTSTLIDLNDLNNSTLWKIYYYVNFCLENSKRKNRLTGLHQEVEQNKAEHEQKIMEELQKKLVNGEISTMDPALDTVNKLYTYTNLPSYETLRDQAVYQSISSPLEQIKITQMKHLNKIIDNDKEVRDGKEGKKKENSFFHAYTKTEKPKNVIEKSQIKFVKLDSDVSNSTQ